jgi:hypothetical protein
VNLLDRFRRNRPPAEALRTLHPSDRLLAWAPTADGMLVASRGGLRRPDGRFVPWHLIDKAVWRDAVLSITEVSEVEPGVYEPRPESIFRLDEPGELPAVVRTRVTRSIAYSSHHLLPRRGGVRVVARRVPGQDGLAWSVRFDPGTDLADPGVREAADQLLADARASATASE